MHKSTYLNNSSHPLSYWETINGLGIRHVDVVVVGSGLVGLSAAIRLLKNSPSRRVVVLEALPFGALASTRNAGFACLGSPSELAQNLFDRGEEHVLKSLNYKWLGLQSLLSLVGKRQAGFRMVPGYDVFDDTTWEGYDLAMTNIDKLNKLAEKVTKIKNLFSECATLPISLEGAVTFKKAIQINWEGQLNSGFVHEALMRKAKNLGAVILNSTPAYEIETDGIGIRINTSRGTITTKSVILATNAKLTNLWSEAPLKPGRGQVQVGSAPKGFTQHKANYHYDKGYWYFRTVGDSLLIGGGRNRFMAQETTDEPSVTGEVQSAISDFAQRIAGDNWEPSHQWAGIMAFTEDGGPLETWAKPGIYAAVGCNGMGVAMGCHIGRRAADAVIKKSLSKT